MSYGSSSQRWAGVAPPSPEGSPSAPPLRVLIIDDEPVVARSVARVLAGADVTTAGDGRDALARLAATPDFDVIVCDLTMPGLSGMDVHAALVTSAPPLVARMLFVTGGAVTPAAQEFLARPDVRHIIKPFERAALLRAIAEVAGRAP